MPRCIKDIYVSTSECKCTFFDLFIADNSLADAVLVSRNLLETEPKMIHCAVCWLWLGNMLDDVGRSLWKMPAIDHLMKVTSESCWTYTMVSRCFNHGFSHFKIYVSRTRTCLPFGAGARFPELHPFGKHSFVELAEMPGSQQRSWAAIHRSLAQTVDRECFSRCFLYKGFWLAPVFEP